jgi:hypothetical protein
VQQPWRDADGVTQQFDDSAAESEMTRHRHAGFMQPCHHRVTQTPWLSFLPTSLPAPHSSSTTRITVTAFLQTLATQRWDDHRYYHHSRINQSLHLLSACSFVVAYVLLFIDPALAAILAWCVSMTSRQAGHFFFEPRGYDHVNDVTDELKEEIKIGYNIRRKIVLMTVWVLIPLVLWFAPSLFGLIEPAASFNGFVHDVGIAWLALGITGLLFRVAQLWMQQSLMTGLAWMTKILTDPFHDIKLYCKAPLYLLRGELIDPMPHVRH